MNSVVSTIGELLQIKPLLKMYDGNATAERVRTRRHAIKRLVDLLHEYGPYEKVALLHSDAADRARELLQEVRGVLPDEEIWFEQINPVLSAYRTRRGWVCLRLRKMIAFNDGIKTQISTSCINTQSQYT